MCLAEIFDRHFCHDRAFLVAFLSWHRFLGGILSWQSFLIGVPIVAGFLGWQKSDYAPA